MEYNRRNPAVKRLMKEAEELRNPTEEFEAYPMQDNLFEWHFTLKGPANTDFSGGLYHGRIILPPDYPMKPPNIMLLTPNGRFEVNKKICLSISGHHPESWQPSWSIRTALLAIIGFMPTHGNGAIGSLDYSPKERQKLAVRSHNWQCPECHSLNGLLPEQKEDISQTGEEDSTLTTREEKSNPIVDSEQSSDDSAERNIDSTFRESDLLQPTDLRNRVSSHIEDEATGDLQVSKVNSQKSSLFDSFSTICIWVILLILTVLLFRRLLFV